MSEPWLGYGWEREPCTELAAWENDAYLMKAWRRSRSTLANLRTAFAESAVPPSVAHLAVSGSLGRMEQTHGSDIDVIVTLHNTISKHERRSVMDHVLRVIDRMKLPRPLSSGIFAEPVARCCLLNPEQRGKIASRREVFGHRIQLLLDAQPVWSERAFRQTQYDVLQWYAQSPVALAEKPGRRDARTSVWRYLNNEILRYYRCLDVEVQWKAWSNEAAREEAERKQAASRRILVAGLVLLLGESLSEKDPVADVASRLPLTPLERVAWAFRQKPSPPLEPLLGAYEHFLRWMNQRSRVSDEDNDRLTSSMQTTTTVSDSSVPFAIPRTLLDYLTMRRDDWPDEFLASCWI